MRKNSWIPHCFHSKSKRRNQRGDFLVEALVAVLVSSILGTALVNMYAQMRRTLNMSSSQLAAVAVAQGVIDHLRTIPYTTLAASTGDHSANLDAGTSDPLFPRALFFDPNLNYTQGIQNVMGNATRADANNFHTLSLTGAQDDSVNINIANATIGAVQGLQITVTMRWRDTSGGIKTYTLQSYITPEGMST